jgi:hypothetical protein
MEFVEHAFKLGQRNPAERGELYAAILKRDHENIAALPCTRKRKLVGAAQLCTVTTFVWLDVRAGLGPE